MTLNPVEWATDPKSRGVPMEASRIGRLCKHCQLEMRAISKAPPFRRGEPGLVIWSCDKCGSADSDLIYPADKPT